MPSYNFLGGRPATAEQFGERGAELENEFRDLMSSYQNHHYETQFDPLPMLERVNEILDWSCGDYYSNNPDPLDTRPPHKVQPNCIFGFLLRYMHRSTDFLDKCLNSYLMPHQNNVDLNVHAARVLVMTISVIDSDMISQEVQKDLYKYALNSESRELRAYSTMLLNPATTPETAHVFKTEIVSLIVKSLDRLKVLYAEMTELPADSAQSNSQSNHQHLDGPTDFSGMVQEERTGSLMRSNEETPHSSRQSEESTAYLDTSDVVELSTEEKSEEVNGDGKKKPETSKMASQQPKPGQKRAAAPAEDDPPLPKRFAKQQPRRDRDARRKPQPVGSMTPLADSFNNELSNCSSTVDGMKKVMVGDHRIYPLTIEMEQRMLLYFLQCAFEFTDHVSVLTEHAALDVVLKYLNVNDYHDVRLLFEALFCLSSMLIHLRLAWDFVNRGGLLKLTMVNRHSVAASAVCVCLHNLSQFDEIMEHVCQGPPKLLDDVISYAVWQLGRGYESCRGRMCAFFSFALAYKNALDRFEQLDGLRVLYNYCNSRINDFLFANFNDEDEMDRLQERMGEFSQVLRNTTTTLTHYVLSHILLKYESIKRNYGNRLPQHLHLAISTAKIPHKQLVKKQLRMDPETEAKALEVLRYVLPVTGAHWHPVNVLRSLGFLSTYIRAVSLRAEYILVTGSLRNDVVHGMLRLIGLTTLTPAAIRDLTEPVTFPQGPRTGIEILLDLLDMEQDALQTKLVLQILLNCLCGPESTDTLVPATNAVSQDQPSTSAKKSKQPPDFHEPDLSNVLERAYTTAQENNAIMTLVQLIKLDEPISDADTIRALACRVLCGMARSEKIRQILSKIPLIANNELVALTHAQSGRDRTAEHADFCNEARALIRLVHQTAALHTEDLTWEKIWRARVVKQTVVKYDEAELLRLIQHHLESQGLHRTASLLQQEAGLQPAITAAITPRSLALPCPFGSPPHTAANKTLNFDEPDNDTVQSVASIPSDEFSSPKSRHSRPKPTGNCTPGPTLNGTPHPMTEPITPTPSRSKLNSRSASTRTSDPCRTPPSQSTEAKRRSLLKSSLLAQSSLTFSRHHSDNATSMTEREVRLRPAKPLADIVKEYFRNEHAQCERPVVTCPPFSFYYPHKCPRPRELFHAPQNIVDRFIYRQLMPHPRITHALFNRADRNMAFSRYCAVDYFDMEQETLTACAFSFDDSYIHLGTYSGDVHWMNVATGNSDSVTTCHNSLITSVEHSRDGALLLTSSVYVRPLSALWRTADTQDVLHMFEDEMDLAFSRTDCSRIVGTQMNTAVIFDTESGERLAELSHPVLANHYQGVLRNKACFNPEDTLVLNDGIVWDVRANPRAEVVRKFDKLCPDYCGRFHPNGHDVLISGYVWDMRGRGLLTFVNALQRSEFHFNNSGDVMFAIALKEPEDPDDQYCPLFEPSFRVFDLVDYRLLSTVDTKRDILGFAVDHQDRHVCTMELGRKNQDPNLCRIYEIGRSKLDAPPDDDDEEEEDNRDDGDEEDDDAGRNPIYGGAFDSGTSTPTTSSDGDSTGSSTSTAARSPFDSEEEYNDDGVMEMINELGQYPEFADFYGDPEDDEDFVEDEEYEVDDEDVDPNASDDNGP